MTCPHTVPMDGLAMVCVWIVAAVIVGLSLVIALSRLDRRLYVRAMHSQRIDSFGVLDGPKFVRCEACGAVHPRHVQKITCACGATC